MNKKLIEEVIAELPKCLSVGDMDKLANKLKQAIASEPQFYYNQHVLVSDIDNDIDPRPALFKGYHKKGDALSFIAHAIGFNFPSEWRHCKPDLSAVSLPHWLPYTSITRLPKLPPGQEYVYSTDGTMYCVIPEPEYLEVSDE